jgi:hypothetical protein
MPHGGVGGKNGLFPQPQSLSAAKEGGEFMCNTSKRALFFAFPKIIPTFDPTNQIFLPYKGVWFLLRRVKRLGSVKPWQPNLNIRRTVPKPNPGKPGDDKN